MNKKIYIIANWKMNPQTEDEARDLIEGIVLTARSVDKERVGVIILPPFIWLGIAKNILSRHPGIFALGAQNVFWQDAGAYTGEISVSMLKNLGCQYVLIGHSEREMYLKENKEMFEKKLKLVLEKGLIPILCLHPKDVNNLPGELNPIIQGLDQELIKKIIFLYEPTEAISTQGGSIPSKDKIIQFKKSLNQILGEDITILYGGSVNSQNVKEFTTDIGLDGALVGAKSLDIEDFSAIIRQFI